MVIFKCNEDFYCREPAREQTVNALIDEFCKYEGDGETFCEKINELMKKHISDVNYEDEEFVDNTAYGALVNKVANCVGFTEVMASVLKNFNIQFETISFEGTNLYGLFINGKVYSPYIEKICDRNSIEFSQWLDNHKYSITSL